jgi:hypothetical protein
MFGRWSANQRRRDTSQSGTFAAATCYMLGANGRCSAVAGANPGVTTAEILRLAVVYVRVCVMAVDPDGQPACE